MERIAIWKNCRNNLIFLRKHFGLTQQQVAKGANLSLSRYQYAERVSPNVVFDEILNFWFQRALFTADELLLFKLNEDYVRERADRAVRNFMKVLDYKY